jgi:hypothetical protein
MLLRAPKRWWEWLLLFSPAFAIWIATAIGESIGSAADPLHWSVVPGFVLGAFIGTCFIAPPLSLVAGFVLVLRTQDRFEWIVRTVCVAFFIGCSNLAIAFVGCGVVRR